MNYLSSARKVYHSINKINFKDLLTGSVQDFDALHQKLQKAFELDELRNSYVNEISKTIDQHIPFFSNDFSSFLKIKEVSYYYHNISSSTLSHLFWIWNHDIKLSDEQLNQFIQSFFLGVFGYKMIDYQKDTRNSNPELSFVGFYSIKLAEHLLGEILNNKITQPVYLKYAKIYTQVEYQEKKNRWKPTFFSWDTPKALGLKAAPTFIVYESLFKFAGYNDEKIDELIDGLTFLSAAMQLIDDLADAKDDLTNGYETLVTDGYFSTFGYQSEVTDEKLNKILDQHRLKKIYKTGQELFSNARRLI
ncbi:MAG: hypothetical protein HXY50_08805 [Ignavibacteriaceae bacterium]|nr:hypothetical protein [Ignavibacteriaceae bacterium]